MSGRVGRLLHRCTLGQWEAIDRDFIDTTRAASPARIGGLFVVVALALVLHKYGASSKVFNNLMPELARGTEWRPLARKLWWTWVVTLSFALPPFLYARFVLGESAAELGLRVGLLRDHALIYAAAFALMVPVIALVSLTPGFQDQYPMYSRAHLSWVHLLVWELSYGAQFAALELLFRGILLVPLARRIGALSVALAALPYCMLHFGKPLPETIGSIFAGLFLGTMALRSRSFMAGIAVHVGVAWSMDLLALWSKGALSDLVGGLFN